MEAAVLRVKRKRSAGPVEALVVSCKRPRAEEETAGSSALSTRVFKLAATVASQNEPVQKYVQEAISRDRSAQVHCPPIGHLQQIQKDLRAWRKAERQESRYHLVSSFRPKYDEEVSKSDNSHPASPVEEKQCVPDKVESSTNEKNETFQVFDIEKEETEMGSADLKTSDPETIMCNSVKMIRERLTVSQDGQCSEHRENPDEFVYDLYYAESSPHNWIQDILSVQPYYYEQELMADVEEPEEVYEDEDDENEENNWRNDYPDEDECSDQEARYMGHFENSDEETECGGRPPRDNYYEKVIRECKYEEEEYSD